MKVIHITGAAGSGKSTLGRKLATKQKISASPKYIVFDTDDVAEEIHSKLMQKNKNLWIKNEAKYNKKYAKEIQTFKTEIMKLAKDQGLDIVIVGFAMDVSDIVTDGYILDVDDKTVYRRRMIRDFEHLLKNQKEIKKILKHEPVEVMEFMLWYKLGIHHPFPAPPFKQAFQWQAKTEKDLIQKGYKKMTPSKILAKLK